MIEFLKPVFDGKALTQEEFETALTEQKIKLGNLSGGEYVSKSKYEADIATRDASINTLNETVEKRDGELTSVRELLEKAGTDESALKDTLKKLTDIEAQSAVDKENYEKNIAAEKYRFSCNLYAEKLDFSSPAAKREFIRDMVAEELKMDGDKVIGADDFLEKYKADNAASFKEVKEEETDPFIDRTPGQKNPPVFNLTEAMMKK